MAVLDWQLRTAMKSLRENGRLNVLIALILHANVRNRCWPSLDCLCNDTGYGLEAVNNAKKWLIEHRAIEVVKYAQRVAEEKKLPPRLNVYQLTGYMVVEGSIYNYLYSPNQSFGSRSIDPSVAETSVAEGKGSSIFKGGSSKESAASTEARTQSLADDETQDLPKPKAKRKKAAVKTAAVEDKSVEKDAAQTQEQKPRSLAQIAAAAPAEALADALGVTLVSADFALFSKVAGTLVKSGVTVAEFDLYVKRLKKRADAEHWTVTASSLTANGRISEYVTARNAYRSRQEAGTVNGAWDGETQSSVQYHQSAPVIREAETVNDDVLDVFAGAIR